MADPIRQALERLLAVIKPKYTDPDEIVAVVRAMAAARTALAAERPAPAPAADGERDHVPDAGNMVAADEEREEREELATFLTKEAVAMDYWFERDTAKKVRRAAALLRQLPPEGLLAVEYVHIGSGARIICEPNEECSGGHWAVLNSRHVNPCTEFRTVADAAAALQREAGDE